MSALRNLTDAITLASAMEGGPLSPRNVHRVGNVIGCTLYDIFLSVYEAHRAAHIPDEVALEKSRDSLALMLAHALSSDSLTASTFSFNGLRDALAAAPPPDPAPLIVGTVVNQAFKARGLV